MNLIIKDEIIRCSSRGEYQSVTEKLREDTRYAGVVWSSEDMALTIKYKTEEITPLVSNNNKLKVLLLFKNPHPDSVAAGLFLSEPHSQAFWARLFEVDYNSQLLPLLNRRDWITTVADTLLSGKYDAPFLYYFRCLYPFPTRQFADLQQLFAGAPLTYKREILDRSLKEFAAYVEQHGIKNVIVFFKDAVELVGGRTLPTSINVVTAAKRGIDQAIAHGDDKLFWQQNSSFRQKTNNGYMVYLNMNTRAKNHGAHLPKRYFTYNLEIILRDIIKNSSSYVKS